MTVHAPKLYPNGHYGSVLLAKPGTEALIALKTIKVSYLYHYMLLYIS